MNALHLCVFLSFAAFLPGQQEPKPGTPQQPDPAKVMAEVLQQFQKEGIELDAKAQTVSIKAVMNQPQDAIEYLLIHRRGKRHEAMFVTKTLPSLLNAAMLMLGFTPGSNADYVERVPRPTLDEIERGVDPVIVTPPKGTPVWITVKWKTPEGQAVEYCIEDLLIDLSTQRPVRGASWVYLGGRLAKIYKDDPEVYVADFEGNLFSVCYMSPDNHLVTMVHENARDDQNWWLGNKLPEPDTEVQFVIWRAEPQIHKDRELRVQKEMEGERRLRKLLVWARDLGR